MDNNKRSEQSRTNDEEEKAVMKAETLSPASSLVLHRMITEAGIEELNSSAAMLFWSSLAAGIVVSTSLIAEAVIYSALPHTSWRHLIVAFGYSIGFILVILGSLRLFTESTITATLPLFYKPSWQNAYKTIRLWFLVITGNLLGTCLCAYLLSAGLLVKLTNFNAVLDVAIKITELDATGTFINAIPAGFLIAMLVWVRPNAGSAGFWCIVAVIWLVGACELTHSIVGSCEAFSLYFAGKISLYHAVVKFLIPAILGNTVGGAVIFGLVVHAHVRDDLG